MSYVHYPKRYEVLETFGEQYPEQHGGGGAIVHDTKLRDTQLHYYEKDGESNVLCYIAYSIDRFEEEYGNMVTPVFENTFEEEMGFPAEECWTDEGISELPVLFERLASYYGSWSVFDPDGVPERYPTRDGVDLFFCNTLKDFQDLFDPEYISPEKWEAILEQVDSHEKRILKALKDKFDC